MLGLIPTSVVLINVAEVTVQGSNFKINRMVAAIDCGQIVNPESVRAQAESAIIYGLSATPSNARFCRYRHLTARS